MDMFPNYDYPKHPGDITINEGLYFVGIDVGDGELSYVVAEVLDQAETVKEMAEADQDRCAVVVGHALLEDALKLLLSEFAAEPRFRGKVKRHYIPFSRMVSRAVAEELIDESVGDALTQMAIIRNKFVHGYSVQRFADLQPDLEVQTAVEGLARFVATDIELNSLEAVSFDNPLASVPPRAAYIYAFDILMNALSNALAEANSRAWSGR